jgi:hypothetical protein
VTTRSELIESITSHLHSYTGVHETVTELAGALTDSATTITVDNGDGARRGVLEIDDELFYISSVSGVTLTVAGFGRGYRGSTAAAHADAAMVTFDPAFPRFEIGKAIDQTIAGLFPKLYQVKETTLDGTVIDVSYALPTDVEQILRVEMKWSQDPTDYWHPVVDWELEKTATPQLNLIQGCIPGASIKVVYAAQFGELTTDFATAGIPESYEDLIVYLVTARMIRFLEPARLQLGSVENVSRAQLIQAGDAGRTATQLYALAQQRIAEERRELLEQYPMRPNYLGR